MKASPLLISWHNDNAPIYSVHFDPNGKGRVATAGNDNNVRVCFFAFFLLPLPSFENLSDAPSSSFGDLSVPAKNEKCRI
jgi:hypothetical protein